MSRIADQVGFVHLRVHSAYSLLEGALQIKKLIALAKGDRMPALGLADSGNLFGALEFSEKMAEAGIQPIVGCQVAIDFGDSPEAERPGIAAAAPLFRPGAGRRHRGRLLEPGPAGVVVVHGNAAGRAHTPADLGSGRRLRGADQPHRRSERTPRPGLRGRAVRGRRRAARAVVDLVPRSTLYRTAAALHARRGGGRAAPPRSRLSARPAAGRHQRGLLPRAQRL